MSEISGDHDALLDLVSTARCLGRLDEALKWLNDVVASGEPNADTYLALGTRHLFFAERFNEAAIWYRRRWAARIGYAGGREGKIGQGGRRW